MPRRSARGYISNKDAILKSLEEGRNAVIDVIKQSKIHSAEYLSAQAALEAINDLAGQLTGDAQYLHLKGHSISAQQKPRE